MKKRLYPRLAWQGIRKNGKIYFPYLAACIFVVMVYYLIGFLSSDPVIREMEGGAQMQIILSLGTGVMGIFSVIFLFYTNSFLMKRRKKELGLYHVLGMDRKNIAVVLIWENLMTAGISLGGGILGGILFSKLGQLAMIYLLGGKADFSFSINSDILIRTLKTYGVIFLLLLAYRILQIFRTRPMDLLKSESLGERPPRANWLSAILGAVLLGAAYGMAVTVKEPVTIIWLFFVPNALLQGGGVLGGVVAHHQALLGALAGLAEDFGVIGGVGLAGGGVLIGGDVGKILGPQPHPGEPRLHAHHGEDGVGGQNHVIALGL